MNVRPAVSGKEFFAPDVLTVDFGLHDDLSGNRLIQAGEADFFPDSIENRLSVALTPMIPMAGEQVDLHVVSPVAAPNCAVATDRLNHLAVVIPFESQYPRL